MALLEKALKSRGFGSYTLQAAIAAVHAEAESVALTDWRQIVALYIRLIRIQPSPVVQLNRAGAAIPARADSVAEVEKRRRSKISYAVVEFQSGRSTM